MNDSRIVANRFLELARDRGRSLTSMQLLKLVYVAHGWMLGLYGRALIRDPIEAWRYGPVIPNLYNVLRRYGGGPVTDLVSQPLDATLDEQEQDIAGQVFKIYGDMTGLQLSALTHAEGTPWSLVHGRGLYNLEIPQDIIQEHYRAMAERETEQSELRL